MKLVYAPFFPRVCQLSSPHPFRAIIGIGGNVGDCVKRFFHVLKWLEKSGKIDILTTSPLLINPPFGYLDQDDFTNGVIEIGTSLSVRNLLNFLHYVEKRFGRKRSFKNAPRTLDLDIIFFETKVVYNRSLQVPHPHWHTRPSVVIPLGMLGTKTPYRRCHT